MKPGANPASARASASRIARELETAAQAPKCHPCGCFLGALRELRAVLPSLPPEAREPIQTVVEAGSARSLPEEYACLGCPICWPANALHLAAQAFPETALGSGAPCPTEPPLQEHRWPPFPGNYRVLDAAGTIAVCVLTSEHLIDALAAARPADVAIVGALYTENLGIERLISNALANRNLDTLIVCGADSKQRIGHLPGQTLLSFAARGVDERRRILGARGRRPVLANLPLEAIAAFQEEIRVVDSVGEENLEAILEIVGSVPDREGHRRFAAMATYPIPVAPPPPLVLDPRGYFILFPDRERHRIRVEHYENTGILRHVFEAERPEALYATILEHDLVSRLDHAAYLGMELSRAEQALRTGAPYVQDRAPEPACSPGCGCP